MEKMEIEKMSEDSPIEEKPIKTPAKAETEKYDTENIMEWICNIPLKTKTCGACKSVMREWAYREPFKYCPKCGRMAKIIK